MRSIQGPLFRQLIEDRASQWILFVQLEIVGSTRKNKEVYCFRKEFDEPNLISGNWGGKYSPRGPPLGSGPR